jgi:hypothetical protein
MVFCACKTNKIPIKFKMTVWQISNLPGKIIVTTINAYLFVQAQSQLRDCSLLHKELFYFVDFMLYFFESFFSFPSNDFNGK